jgi:uncharacterized membrane protein
VQAALSLGSVVLAWGTVHTIFTTQSLRHALLSYLFGAVVLATTINLIAGLAK